MPNTSELIEGLILCGGKAERMGGVDKGLIKLQDKPLVTWVAENLAQQVSRINVNANRCIDQYEGFGFKVLPDVIEGFAGPLAGFHAGLKSCELPYLLVVPCDSPLLPINLAHQLLKTLSANNLDITYAATPSTNPKYPIQTHPVFCLMKKDVLPSLEEFLASGDRKIDRWFKKLKNSEVIFSDENAFSNINTPEELEKITQLLP
jgi:molybdopterin-guanine dinucleotide biosynthesis protein A